MNNFKNKVALVTGSSRGIGKSIAYQLAKKGATVILHASQPSSQAILSLKEIKLISPKSKIYYVKIENYNDVVNFSKDVEKKYKKIDILVNNAGITRDRTLLKMSYKEWDEVIKVNLYGLFNITKNFLPLINDYGRIISVSSVVAQLGAFGQTNYASSKAGVIGFTKSLSLELAKKNITVNAICPGYTETDMTKSIPKDVLDTWILPKIPLKRLAKPEEIAKLVIYLSSPDASYVTGQVININGGLI